MKKNILTRIVILLILSFSFQAFAQSLTIEEMPSVQQIESKILHANPVKLKIRQAAALKHMQTLVVVLDGKYNNPLTPAEQRIYDNYTKQYEKLVARDVTKTNSNSIGLTENQKLLDYFSIDKPYRDSVYAYFFSVKQISGYENLINEYLIKGTSSDQANTLENTVKEEKQVDRKFWEDYDQLEWNNLIFILISVLVIGFMVIKSDNKSGCILPIVIYIISFILLNSWFEDWPFAAMTLGGLFTLLMIAIIGMATGRKD